MPTSTKVLFLLLFLFLFSVSFLVLFALCSFVSCSHAGPDLTGADLLFESNFIESKDFFIYMEM